MDHPFRLSSLQDTPPKIFINDKQFFDHDTRDHTPTPQSLKQESITSRKSFSTVSSNSLHHAGRRIGALATRLERAITRWARTNWADSSSSLDSASSSTSSRSSFRTANKSTRRKRRPPSFADIQHRIQSERAVAARLRARELRRVVPREFNLYIPPLHPSKGEEPIDEAEQIVRTFSLDQMLPHLDSVLRKYDKPRRARHHARAQSAELDQPHYPHNLRPPQSSSSEGEPGNSSRVDPSGITTSPKEEKGKHKLSSIAPPPNAPQVTTPSPRDSDPGNPQQAWWLDVASPSWEDMKALGKLLHLHPLTLEDILQQEPREKLELFPKLGYYFIIFRAVESLSAPAQFDVVRQKTGSSQLSVYGSVIEFNIYLVVFRHGICTFHFSNISEHLDRVRGRLQTAAQTTRRSSAWIAHGILDSVVDSLFPFVKEIEEHVATMETIIYDEKTPMSTSRVNPMEFLKELKGPPAQEKASSTPFANEKQASVKVSPPKLDFRLIWRRVRRAFFHLIRFCLRREPRIISSVTHTSFGIHHMARARRLVTSVARVWATKPEVLAGIRKRLLIPDGLAAGDDTELVIYFGDVQDHVLALQQSLTHFERVLSEWRPTYLQMLRSNFVKTRVKIDSNIFTLTLVHVVSLPPQVLAGALTVNVRQPTNLYDGKYWLFALVLVLTLLIQVVSLSFVRSLWMKAGRKAASRR